MACLAPLAAAATGASPAARPTLQQAQGIPLASQARAWVDSTGVRTVETVAASGDSLPWKPFDPRQPYRIDDKALWLQFEANPLQGSRWYLVLMHPSVDRIDLYHQEPDGRWVTQSAGGRLPVSEWAVPGRLPTFELAPAAREGRYWVRLERDRSDFSVPLRLFEQSALLEYRATEQFLFGAYFGLLLLLGIGAMVSAVAYRERKFAAFVLYLLAIAGVQLVYLGLGAQHLWTGWPYWNEMARLVVPGPAAAAGLWFVKSVTEPARFSRALDLACSSLVAALLAAVALNAFVDTRASFLLVMVLMAATVPTVVALLALAWRRGRDPYVGTLALGFAPVLVAALFPLAYVLNLLPNTVLARHALTWGTALHLPLVYFVLSRRSLRRRETVMRAEQLGHSDALTGLCDRDTLVQRLDDAIRRAIGQRHFCALLGVRLTNHEALEQQLGRATADRALVVAASILRAASGDSDLAARVGERDFVLLLEGPTHAAAANARAQQIVAQGLQHAPVLPPGTTLRFHVAVVLLPDGELDPPRCLLWLDQACDAMRAEPRRAIRSLNF